jgi:hypothetical protein
MADVFISYKREDRAAAERIARALEALGIAAWFDGELAPGAAFTSDIERELHACKAQIVCWSPAAVGSEWVLGEAHIGRERNVLVPVVLAHCHPPPPFNMFHAESLAGFDGGAEHPGWLKVSEILGIKLERPGLRELPRLLDHGAADAWKAWAEANPLDPYAEKAWTTYEALSLDAERNRLALEREAARAAALKAEADRQATEERARVEAARLERLREADRKSAEDARRAGTLAETAPKPERATWTGPLLFAGVAALVTIAGLSALVLMRPDEKATHARAVEPPAALRAITPAAAAAYELAGAWRAAGDTACADPISLSVETDAEGEWLVTQRAIASNANGLSSSADAVRRERILGLEAGAVRTGGDDGGRLYRLQGEALSLGGGSDEVLLQRCG